MTAAAADSKTKIPSIASRISDFLEENPDGPLKIATGYASFWGLKWLNEHTSDRESVDVLIGSLEPKYFLKASLDEIEGAEEFVSRDNVSIWELDRGSKKVHSKAWIADKSVLSGSSNLTRQGLYRNSETMGEYSGRDKYQAFKQVHELIFAAEPACVVISAYADCVKERISKS